MRGIGLAVLLGLLVGKAGCRGGAAEAPENAPARPPAEGLAKDTRRATAGSTAGCEEVFAHHRSLLGPYIGESYVELLDRRRADVIAACVRHASEAYLACVHAAPDADALQACLVEFDPARGLVVNRASGLVEASPMERARAPTAAACELQADRRIELHDEFELPSVARAVAATRDSMISTCKAYWSEPYVHCLLGSPTLTFATACETVGRTRTGDRVEVR